MIVASLDPGSYMPGLAMPRVGPPWDVPSLHLTVTAVTVGLWLAAIAGTAGVTAGLVAIRRGARVSPRLLIGAGLALVAILTILPPAGSTDILDYATYGRIVCMGHTPYVWAPYHLRALGGKLGSQVPAEWDTQVTLYGPLATFEQFLAAVLGGSSLAKVVFWLKLWNSIAFATVAFIADRALRGDLAARLRAHLLWTVNPLLLWGLIAAGHVDMIAAGTGLIGLLTLGVHRTTLEPSLRRAAAAGVLLGIAADIKIPYLIFTAAAIWVLRRCLRALLTAAGAALAVLVPTYVWYGPPAVEAVLTRASKVTADNIYQLFSTPAGFVIRHLLPISLCAVVALAVLTSRWLPSASHRHLALRPALALGSAWLFVWPYQLPWYDVMIFCLVILYPASRLDLVVLTRLTAGTIALMPGAPALPGHLAITALHQAVLTVWVPVVLLGCIAALIYLCVTGRWRMRKTRDIATPTARTSSPAPART